MTQPLKVLAAIVGMIALIAIALFLWVLTALSADAANYYPPEIVNFHPTTFRARADTKFFYTISGELKYSDELTPDAPSLLRGRIGRFLVSPDNRRIAVVTDGTLKIVSNDQSIMREVVPVSSIYRTPKPIGEQFFRDDGYQWSKDSRSLYLIKDEYYQSKGAQLYSRNGELWRYEIETGDLRLVLKPFPAFKYFLGKNAGIYFSVPDTAGDVHLKYFDGEHVRDVGRSGSREVPAGLLSPDSLETIFFSFSPSDYVFLKPSVHPSVRKVLQSDSSMEFLIGTKTILAFKPGRGIKGQYSCYREGSVLPGDRYFLLNVNCRNHSGQLLVDTVSGDYMALEDTRVYLTPNTSTISFRITNSGIEPVPTPSINTDAAR